MWKQSRWLWSQLRAEIDDGRASLDKIPMFVKKHLESSDISAANRIAHVVDELQLHFCLLERSESSLKDHISMHSSGLSAEMAEQSINESRRITLCES